MKINRTELYSSRLVLLVLMALTLVPFVSMFLIALHPSGSYPAGIDWPADPQWGNFITAFNVANMGTIFGSSLLIVVLVVPVSLIFATMAGFAIGHLRIAGARLLLPLFLFGLTLPYESIVTPLYYLEKSIGVYDTRLAIALPLIALYMPFGVYWLRSHFVSVPREISEAARVDGAGVWNLFWKVHVPLARPAITSLAILTTVWTWNQFILALVLVEDPTQRTAAGALGAFQGHYANDYPLLCAGSIVILLPTILVFIAFQRQVITALLQGSVKG